MHKLNVDILIIGGGLTGASLLFALAPLNLNVLLIDNTLLEKKISDDFDSRSLALSPATIRILKSIDLWPALKEKITPIEKIHISQQGYLGSSILEQKKEEETLGGVVEIHYINQLIEKKLDKNKVLAPATLVSLDSTACSATVNYQKNNIAIHAKLIVAADGANSAVRTLLKLPAITRKFNQFALSANIGLERSHQNVAYERFTSGGPLAMLPLTHQRASMIWCHSEARASELLNSTDDAFLAQLQLQFGYRLGRFIKLGQRCVYPLKQCSMAQITAWPYVFIGNAANTLHPVAGQGFNLGLRDAVTLAQCISEHGLTTEMLTVYANKRRHDHQTIQSLTYGLATLFTHNNISAGLIRGLGLMAFDNSYLLKKLLADYASGYGGTVPDLACGIPLKNKKI